MHCTGLVSVLHVKGLKAVAGSEELIMWWAQALAEATGRSVAQINKEYDEQGDLGIVAASARGKQKPMFKPAPLTIAGVLDPSPVRLCVSVSHRCSKQKEREQFNAVREQIAQALDHCASDLSTCEDIDSNCKANLV